ncbi:MAG: alpha/beta fold hydrolase [Candidatus Komeilibacteria bacterium]|nr:alpha/beta fold hydrolase [Candidatus Komeilibacteria bacterium]
MNLIKTKSFELAVIIKGNENAKKLAILIPGRLDTKDYAHFVSHLDYLANKGFLAVCFDPPGTWESPGEINLCTTTNYIKSTNELIEYYGNKPTLLLGHSRGATTAMLASSNNSVTDIVLIMATYGAPTPPTNKALQEGFEVSYRDLPPGESPSDEKKKFLLPLNYWKDGELHNPLQALQECTKPKLLVYGTKDKFTAVDEVKKIYQNLLEPKMIQEVEAEHDYRYNSQAINEVNQTVGQFLDNYAESKK